MHDIIWVFLAVYLSFALRFDFASIPQNHLDGAWQLLWVGVVVQALSYWYFGLYRGIWRFASLPDLQRIVQAVVVGVLLTYAILFVWTRLDGLPRSTFILYPMVLIAGLAGMRLLYRWLKDRRLNLSLIEGKRTLIVGAGKAGELLLRDILKSDEYVPICFIDDAKRKLGSEIHGVRVMGDLTALSPLIVDMNIDVVLIAMPSAPSELLQKMVQDCAKHHVLCRTVPSLKELAEEVPDVNNLRNIRLEDLLGRDVVSLDDRKVAQFIRGKRVMVTGAGGSIGSELCRQL
ncbi:MAG: polysaccharide biosynthesis protein, partial [Ghiorsea sp.]